jgi:hypothetical protein
MSHPFEIFGSQNLHDDDGDIIASYDIEVDAPPDIKEALQPIPAEPEKSPVVCTRLITGTMTLDATIVEPFLLLAADAERQQFRMDVLSNAASPTNADYVLIADEKSKLQLPVDGSVLPGGLMKRVHTGKDFPLDVHTGALWVRPNPGITGTIEISWAATTK